MIDVKSLRLVTRTGMKNFAEGRILDGIAALRTLLPYCPSETILQAETESLEENYRHMLTFLGGGAVDEKRGEVQRKIQLRGVGLLSSLQRAIRLALKSDFYCLAFEQTTNPLERWNALLTPEESSEVQDDLFDLLWTSALWTPQDTASWYDFLLRQREMVACHLVGAVFLSAWEHYDAEKLSLLGLMTESEAHRIRISAATYLLMLHLRWHDVAELLPPLPRKLTSKSGQALAAQVQREMLLMLVSEKDLEREMKEAESITNKLLTGDKKLNVEDVKDVISLRGQYLKNRLKRGLDINLSKIPLLHSSGYMRRVSHWFLPFDKTHPLFQSVMIDENGREKQNLSTLVDLILDCDIDKIAMLYLVGHDKDFSKAMRGLDQHELPDVQELVIPQYSVHFIMQDLYRFFCHSPLSSQLKNPFRSDVNLLQQPETRRLFSAKESIACCELLFELGRTGQVLDVLSSVMERDGASAGALLLEAKALWQQKKFGQAISSARNAELLQPNDPDILQFLVESLAQQKRFDEELECLQKLSEQQPDNQLLRRLTAATLRALGRHEEALALLFQLDYEMDDDDARPEVLEAIADTALQLGRLDVAERYTEKETLTDDAHKPTAWLRMGHIRLLEGKWGDAISHYLHFAETHCSRSGQDISTALSRFRSDWTMLTAKGIDQRDLCLISDIIQASRQESEGGAQAPSAGQSR